VVTKTVETSSPNKVLADWLSANEISVAQCSRDLDYHSNYVYKLLARVNPVSITTDVIGRLLMTYGPDGPAWPVAQALIAQREREAQSAPPARRGTGPLRRRVK
jgi:hypothetical protein